MPPGASIQTDNLRIALDHPLLEPRRRARLLQACLVRYASTAKRSAVWRAGARDRADDADEFGVRSCRGPALTTA